MIPPKKMRTRELPVVKTSEIADACYFLKRGNLMTGVTCEVQYDRRQQLYMVFTGPHILQDQKELWGSRNGVDLFEIPDVLRHLEAFLPGGTVPPVETVGGEEAKKGDEVIIPDEEIKAHYRLVREAKLKQGGRA